jgi:hypothetical protein
MSIIEKPRRRRKPRPTAQRARLIQAWRVAFFALDVPVVTRRLAIHVNAHARFRPDFLLPGSRQFAFVVAADDVDEPQSMILRAAAAAAPARAHVEREDDIPLVVLLADGQMWSCPRDGSGGWTVDLNQCAVCRAWFWCDPDSGSGSYRCQAPACRCCESLAESLPSPLASFFNARRLLSR